MIIYQNHAGLWKIKTKTAIIARVFKTRKDAQKYMAKWRRGRESFKKLMALKNWWNR